LIATVLLLFMVQAQAILANPLAIVLIAIPLILQTYLIFLITRSGCAQQGSHDRLRHPGP
jgi:ACR3 family arsenite transporter